jgi:RNA-binding protein Musashi
MQTMPSRDISILKLDTNVYITESLKDYFSQFGEVSECTVMRDSATGRSRGFGFLTFRDPKCVNTVMVKEHYLDGKIVSLQ